MTAETAPQIGFRIEGAVAHLTLARPAAGNPLGAQARGELNDALSDLATRTDIRCLLIRAEGKAFCVGGDLAELAAQAPLAPALGDMVASFHTTCEILARLPIPVVAAVQGAVAGGGLALVALSDYVIASEAAQFVFAYQSIGLSSDGGLTWLLPRLMGVRAFQRFALKGDRFGAHEALGAGLVSEVVAADALDDRATVVASGFAQGPTRSFGKIKQLLRASMGQDYTAHLERERDAMVRLADTDDAHNAVTAAFERRTPTYVGR